MRINNNKHDDKILLKSKRSQNEIIGFVVIVLLVVVVAVIFLGIGLSNQGNTVPVSEEISKFLSASLAYTSDCAEDYEPNYLTLGDLARECYTTPMGTCLDGEKYCDILEEYYKEILDQPNTWRAGKDWPTKSYDFSVYYQEILDDPDTRQPKIFEINAGNSTVCPVKRKGEAARKLSSGWLIIDLGICQESR